MKLKKMEFEENTLSPAVDLQPKLEYIDDNNQKDANH